MAMVCFRGKSVAVEAAQTQAIQGRLSGQGRRAGEDRRAPAYPRYSVNRHAQGKASQAQADIEEIVGRRELAKQTERAPALPPSSVPHSRHAQSPRFLECPNECRWSRAATFSSDPSVANAICRVAILTACRAAFLDRRVERLAASACAGCRQARRRGQQKPRRRTISPIDSHRCQS